MRTVLTVLVFLLVTRHSGYGQSLAEIAKKEEARRRSVTMTSRVYTNQDLPETTPPPGPPPSDPATGETPAGSPTTGGEKPDATGVATEAGPASRNEHRGEQHWRERAQQQRARLSEVRANIAALETRLETLRSEKPTPGILSEIKLSEQDLLKFQKSLRSIEKTGVELEQKARAAGASAWIQE